MVEVLANSSALWDDFVPQPSRSRTHNKLKKFHHIFFKIANQQHVHHLLSAMVVTVLVLLPRQQYQHRHHHHPANHLLSVSVVTVLVLLPRQQYQHQHHHHHGCRSRVAADPTCTTCTSRANWLYLYKLYK